MVIPEEQVPDPNGLTFSPDFRRLYVASTGKGPGDTGRRRQGRGLRVRRRHRQQGLEPQAVHRLHDRRRQVRTRRLALRRRRQRLDVEQRRPRARLQRRHGLEPGRESCSAGFAFPKSAATSPSAARSAIACSWRRASRSTRSTSGRRARQSNPRGFAPRTPRQRPRSPLRRLAPVAWLARSRSLATATFIAFVRSPAPSCPGRRRVQREHIQPAGQPPERKQVAFRSHGVTNRTIERQRLRNRHEQQRQGRHPDRRRGAGTGPARQDNSSTDQDEVVDDLSDRGRSGGVNDARSTSPITTMPPTRNTREGGASIRSPTPAPQSVA